MINRPYDMNVPKSELATATVWWNSLSINQMKELEAKHFPWRHHSERMIHQMWEEEGKPAPEPTIPVQ